MNRLKQLRPVKLFLGVFFILIIGFLFNSILVSADSKKSIIEAISSGDMNYVVSHIDSFKLYHESTGVTDFSANSSYFLGDLIWSFDVLIYSTIDNFINILFNTASMSGLINWASGISKSLFSGLSGLITIAFSIGAIISVWFYFSKGRTAALKQLIQMLLVLVVSAFWFTNVGGLLNNVNSLSDNLGATVATSVNKAMGSDHSKDTYTALVSKNHSTSMNSVSMVRKDYFDNSIYSLWKIGTFGEMGVKGNVQREFLKDKPLTAKEVDKAKSIKVVKPYSAYLEKPNADIKSSTAFAGFFVVVLNGIPYLGIGILNWIVTMIIMTITFGMPVLALLSFFPKYNRSLYNGISKIVLAFLAKGIVVLLIVVVGLSTTIVKALTSGLGTPKGSGAIGVILVASILQFLLLYLLWRNRGQILSTLSGGTVTNVPYADDIAHRAKGLAQSSQDAVNHGQNALYAGFNKIRGVDESTQLENSDDESGSVGDDEQNLVRDDENKKYESDLDDLDEDDDENQDSDVEDETNEDETDEEELEEENPDVDIPEDVDEDDPDVDVPEDMDEDDPDVDIPSDIDEDDPDVDIPEDIDEEDSDIDVPENVDEHDVNSDIPDIDALKNIDDNDEIESDIRRQAEVPESSMIMPDSNTQNPENDTLNPISSQATSTSVSPHSIPIHEFTPQAEDSDTQVYEEFGHKMPESSPETHTSDIGRTTNTTSDVPNFKNIPNGQVENDGTVFHKSPEKSSAVDVDSELQQKRDELEQKNPNSFMN